MTSKKSPNKYQKTLITLLKNIGKYVWAILPLYIVLRTIGIDLLNVFDCNRHEIKPFRNSTFNVLILPFRNYEGNSTLRNKIELALNAHLDDLIDKRNFDKKIKSNIKIKCELDIPEHLS